MWIGLLILAAQALAPPSAGGQTNGEKAFAPSIVELRGTVSSVELARGSGEGVAQRGCLLHVKTEERGVIPVRLGPMRYLMEHSFSPRAGDEVSIRGYRLSTNEESDEIVALSVDLPGRNQKLELRDERGRPVWSDHHGRHRRGRGGR
jgi:hypothetical protein